MKTPSLATSLRRAHRDAITLSVLLLGATGIAQQRSSIVTTKHNLSASGPGEFRAERESQICVFCHAPHRARAEAPLWNREDTRASYLTYESSTLSGTVGQPNGTTKLCLSCHDGTIALGKVVSLREVIPMLSGRQLLNAGPGLIGTNLRDDHPVSFHYASTSSTDYHPWAAIRSPVKLDDSGMMQCTSCHDAHDDSHGSFLRTSNRHGALCLACHSPAGWQNSAHALATTRLDSIRGGASPEARYATVAENACANCHRTHGAGAPARLLVHPLEEDNCMSCHDGMAARTNLATDLGKLSGHSPFQTTGVHDPAEDPRAMTRHAECVDCHDPHAALSGHADAPGVPGPIVGASGVNSSGNAVTELSFGYELCYKCHADGQQSAADVPRLIRQTNVRLEFSPGNPSFHPVESTGRNPDVPSLLPPWTTASRMACTDCHQSDSSPDFGGNGAAGPHGSVFRPLLGANYETRVGIPESPTAYALCYKCHSRTSILEDRSFRGHRQHVVGAQLPCSACHDAHGVSASQGTDVNNSHLINFDARLVRPVNGVLAFVDLGPGQGSCTLACHGKNHDDVRY